MGRYAKNTEVNSGQYAVRLPVGSTAVGPDVPVDGQTRFNTTNSSVEFFYNAKWNILARVGKVPIIIDDFVGNGEVVSFTMSQRELSETDIVVMIGGVYQQPIQNYIVDGDQLTFTSPPPPPGINPNRIVVVHNLNSTDAPNDIL